MNIQTLCFMNIHRLLEEGRIAEAEKEKSRIENLQRDRRKQREATKQEYKPVWFRYTPG